MLLRAGLSSLSLLCLERCRCVELLLHALFSSERLLGLLCLRASAGSGRHRCFTEAAPRKRQTRHEHEKNLFHLAPPIDQHGELYHSSRFWEVRNAHYSAAIRAADGLYLYILRTQNKPIHALPRPYSSASRSFFSVWPGSSRFLPADIDRPLRSNSIHALPAMDWPPPAARTRSSSTARSPMPWRSPSCPAIHIPSPGRRPLRSKGRFAQGSPVRKPRASSEDRTRN